jgi:iron complex outermembrane recepter protein
MKPNLTFLAVSLAVTAMAQVAHAAGDAERELAPMQVSADQEKPVQQRTELGKLTEYTPLAGSVVSREELETVRFVDSFHELLPRVPGISMSRNMRFTDGGKNYTENRVDGMRARNTGTYTFIDQVNAGDIERIEFIRGPGSVLSGSNAIGGTINVITRDPPAKREFEATGEAMDSDGYRAGISGGGPLTDNLGYFFNVNRLDNQGWREHSEQTKDSFSTKWVIRPDQASKLALRLEYIHDDYQDPGSLDQGQFAADWRQAQPGSFFRTDIKYTTPSLHYRRMIGDAGELNIFGQSRFTESTAKTSVTGTINDNDANENNLQLMYKQGFGFASSVITGGIDLLRTDSRTKNYANLSRDSFAFSRGDLSGDSQSYERHTSPFLQYEVSPLQRLRLTLGVRQDRIEYEVDDKLRDAKDGSKDYQRVVGKGGATFDLDRDNLIWVNVAEGFMGPGVSTLLGSGGATPATHAAAVASKYVPANMDLQPEDSVTREIGLRGRLGPFRYDTGYYYTEFRNLIVSQLCNDTELCYTRNENAAKAHASGVETMLGYDVTPWLELGLSHTYARYNYDEYVTATANYTGKERYYTPRNHVNLRAAVRPAAGWKVELEMDHIDSYYTNQSLTDEYQRPDLYNLRASYHGKQWGFWLHLLNLLDTRYAERLSSTDAGVRNSYGTGYTPLTLRAGVSYRF